MKNKRLQKIYDTIYQKGEEQHYTPNIFSSGKMREDRRAVLREVGWRGKNVIDVGCGTGELAYHIARKGANNILGIDYSPEAIEVALRTHHLRNLSFRVQDIEKIRGTFDVITCMGTLEHTNDPFATLKFLKSHLTPRGSLIVTCPNWTNPRGYMLQLLFHLFRARITLADLHYLTPIEFERWAKQLRMSLSWRTVYHDWGVGEMLVADFQRRLPNIVKELPISVTKTQIGLFLAWLDDHMVPLEKRRGKSRFGGAVGIYHLRKI